MALLHGPASQIPRGLGFLHVFRVTVTLRSTHRFKAIASAESVAVKSVEPVEECLELHKLDSRSIPTSTYLSPDALTDDGFMKVHSS